MTWVRRDDQASIHRKVAPLDDGCYRLWSEAIEWCSRNGTDGRIGAKELAGIKRGTPARAKVLVAQDLWHEAGVLCGSDRCPPTGPDGWVIHDYLDYNPSRAEVIADKRAKAERTRRWRESKNGRQPRDGAGDASQDSHVSSRDGPVMPPRPVPPRPEGSGAGTPRALPAASVLAARPATGNGSTPTGERCRDCGNALTSSYHLGACLRATAIANGAAS